MKRETRDGFNFSTDFFFLLASLPHSPKLIYLKATAFQEPELAVSRDILNTQKLLLGIYQSNERRKLYYLILLFIAVRRPLKVRPLGCVLQNKRAAHFCGLCVGLFSCRFSRSATMERGERRWDLLGSWYFNYYATKFYLVK